MSNNEPRLPNSELLRCMLALCLSDSNSYRRSYHDLSKQEKKRFLKHLNYESTPDKKGDETSMLFDIAPNTLSDNVLLTGKAGMNRGSAKQLISQSKKVRLAFIELFPETELRHLEPLGMDDFEPEVVRHGNREDHLFTFAKKLGFCKRDEDTGHFLLTYGETEVDRMAVITTIDEEKNTVNKPGCGVNLSEGFAERLFNKYKGVYALYFPSSYMGSKDEGYLMAALRVSHILKKDQSRVIRIKLNTPNIELQKARYQYRGYLSPVGDKNHLNLTLYLATQTINREEYLPDASPLDPETLNIICSRMPGVDSAFRGMLLSLNQRGSGSSQFPYAAKVVLKKQLFEGTEKEVFLAERKFMMNTGLGYFNSVNSLLEYILHRPEHDAVKNYFLNHDNKSAAIFSEPML